MNYTGIYKVNYIQPPYEFIMYGTKIIPWYGKSYEPTYMNNTKLLNQDPVLTYDYIKLYNNTTNYKQFKSPIYEGFGYNCPVKFIVLFIVLIVFICLLFY